jgi:hypothetical protein
MKSIFTVLAACFTLAASAQCPVVTGAVTDVSCPGGADGAINLTVSDGAVFQTSTRGLLISEVHANPTGTDAPFEFVELIATRSIDFSVTPYTVIFSNNGTANANGWIAGGAISYAFAITTGTVDAGDIIYVGGSSMIPQTNRFRTIATGTTGGDGGIGNANNTGSLGNGGTNADGVAVFNVPVASITSSTVPVDVIMWGTAVGNAVVSAGTQGYEMPVNDHYSGGKLQTTSFIAPDQGSVTFLAASGAYDVQTNTFTTPRTWTNTPTFTDLSSSVSLSGLYNFSWASAQTTQNITNLAAGFYIVTVTDAAACSTSDTFLVSEPPAFAVTFSTEPTDCGNSTGTAAAEVTGGTPGYTYLWLPGNMTTDSVGALAAGTYTVEITDLAGCTFTATTTITGVLNTQVAVTHASCHPANGPSDGAITVNVLNGSGPYSFVWSPNVSTSSTASNLAAGMYIITSTDNGGCTALDTAVVLQPTEIITSLTAVNPLCAGGCDGSASATVTGGTPAYTFLWSSGCTTISCGNLCAGCETLFVTDMNGCRDTATTCLIDPAPLAVSTTATPASCAGACDGTLTATSTGGTGSVAFAWSNIPCATPACTSVCAGTYTVTATDVNGCTAAGSVSVTEPAPAWLNAFGSDTTICDPATITVCAPAGYVSYAWSTGTITMCETVDTSLCLMLMVVDSAGCISLDSICITDDLCMGVTATEHTSLLKVYPNPSSGIFTLQSSATGTLVIRNALGEMIGTQVVNADQTEIDLRAQPSGMYVLMMIAEDGTAQSVIVAVE